jgi:flagellar basal-body rod modification protein FlgD
MAAAGVTNLAAVSGDAMAANRASASAATSSGATGSGSTTSSQSSSSGITANDFLTLLVTEMKNQDPTANTDPNEYINQLVNVNSLQQLISINETLTGAFGSSGISAYAQTARASTHASAQAEPAVTVTSSDPAQSSLVTPNSAPAPSGRQTYEALLNRLTHGNLSMPSANPAAERLAHALDGHANPRMVTK